MSLYLGSEKVENVTAQITLPVEPSDDLPLADGTASAGTSKKFSRADHVHPMETVEATLVDLPSAEELGAIPAPTSGTAGQVLTKTADGQEWKDATSDADTVLLKNIDITMPASTYWRSVCYGNGKFVAVAYDSSIAAYSADGINWTQSTLPVSKDWQLVCYGNTKFVAVANNSSTTVYSADGINWTKSTLPVYTYWRSVCYGDGKFVAVSINKNIAAYSDDGINWTQSTLPANAYWQSVCYGDDKFVAVARNSSIAAYSADGINWISSLKKLQYPDGTDIHEQVKEALQIKIPEPESEVFVCTFTQSGSTYTCDKTFDEIQEAYTIGKVCIAKYSYYAYYLEYAYIYGLVFCHTRGTTQEEFTLGQDNTITHVQRTLSTPPTARKVTLTTSGWSNNQQSVTCTGVSSSATSQEIRVMPADATKTSAYVSCGVSCVAQAANKLTFACDKVPTTAIDVYVVMQSLNFQS